MAKTTKIHFEEQGDSDTKGMIRAEVVGDGEDILRMLVAVLVGDIQQNNSSLFELFHQAVHMADSLAKDPEAFKNLQMVNLKDSVVNQKVSMVDEVNELQASQQQKRMFFALCNELGVDAETAKESIKKKYQIDSFANISKVQLTEIIDKMVNRINNKTQQALIEFIKMNNYQSFLDKEVGEEYANYPEFIAVELLKYFDVKEKKFS